MLKGPRRESPTARNGPIRDDDKRSPSTGRRPAGTSWRWRSRRPGCGGSPRAPSRRTGAAPRRSCTSPPEGRHRARGRRRASKPGRHTLDAAEAAEREAPRPRPGRRPGPPRRQRARNGGPGVRPPPSRRCPDSRRVVWGSPRDACAAGARPKMRAGQARCAASVKSSTTGSILVSARRGISGGARRSSGSERPGRQHDTERAPDAESNRLSVRSCRTSRRRPAPSAARIANSRCRAEARRQQQVRDVGARDQKHHAHGREQDPEHRPESRRTWPRPAESTVALLAAVGLRISFSSWSMMVSISARAPSSVTPRARASRARASPSGCPDPANPARRPSGQPGCRCRRAPRRSERRREHAHDRVGSCVQLHGTAHDRRVPAEAGASTLRGQQRRARRPRPVVGLASNARPSAGRTPSSEKNEADTSAPEGSPAPAFR